MALCLAQFGSRVVLATILLIAATLIQPKITLAQGRKRVTTTAAPRALANSAPPHELSLKRQLELAIVPSNAEVEHLRAGTSASHVPILRCFCFSLVSSAASCA